MNETDWKPAETTKCMCGSRNVKYRISDDDECHDDAEYKCNECGKTWWIDGIDS